MNFLSRTRRAWRHRNAAPAGSDACIDTAGLSCDAYSSMDEWQSGQTPRLGARWSFNALLSESLLPDALEKSEHDVEGDARTGAHPASCASWPGHCPLCREAVQFLMPSLQQGGSPDLREEMLCSRCGINARSRAGLMLAAGSLDGTHRIYITEQVSRTFVWLQRQCGDAVIGSEFEPRVAARLLLAANLRRMGGHGAIRFEDSTALTFDDGALDAILTYDVLEHVPAYEDALREFGRVLKPGGTLVVTIPFRPDCAETITRARIGDDGTIEHLLEPEYHGDPLGAGVLCYYHFGWDLLDKVRNAGFASARMVLPWSPSMGLFSGLWTVVARR